MKMKKKQCKFVQGKMTPRPERVEQAFRCPVP